MNIGIRNQTLDDTELNNFKNAIESYIAKNFIVIPCNNKRPILKDWTNIEEQDSEEIFEYFKSGKANQIGIRTDDVFVVDIDYDQIKNINGYESLKQLKNLIPDNFDETLQAKTPRGGTHFYFRKPEDIEIKNTTNLAPGIDIRGRGGFVVAYPTRDYNFIDPGKKPSMPSKNLLDLIHGRIKGNVTPMIKNTSDLNTNEIIGKVQDGREALMQKIVYKNFAKLKKDNNLSFETLFAFSKKEYFEKAQARPGMTLEQEGRGETELKNKCEYVLKRFNEGVLDLEFAEQISAEDIETFTANQLMMHEIPERSWIWKDWHMEKTIANIYGIGGIGKSTFLLSLANHISQGLPFCGSKTKAVKTLCVFCEEDKDEISRRQQQVQFGFAMMSNNSNLFITPRIGHDNLLITFDQNGEPKKGKFFYQLYNFIKNNQIGYLILDTLSDVFGGSEIIRAHVNYFMKAVLGQLTSELGVSILISGHPSVSGMSAHKFSGSTAWQGATRSLWYMDKNEDGTRELTRLKSNYSKSGDDVKIHLIYEDGVFKQILGYAKPK
jgi:hypothetical protein